MFLISISAVHAKSLVAILHLLVALSQYFRAPIRLPDHVSIQVVVVQVRELSNSSSQHWEIEGFFLQKRQLEFLFGCACLFADKNRTCIFPADIASTTERQKCFPRLNCGLECHVLKWPGSDIKNT